jgi:hypothetical protein
VTRRSHLALLATALIAPPLPDAARAQPCAGAPTVFEKASAALTAEYAGALLLIGQPKLAGEDQLDVVASQQAQVLDRGCYAVDGKLRSRRLWLAINNHAGNAAATPAYVGVQVLKFFATSGVTAPLLAASQNSRRPWYFEGRKVPPYGYREWRGSLREWNTRANNKRFLDSYRRAVLPVLKGYWHGSARVDEPTAWDRRDWWRLNPDLQARFDMVVENRLISFEPAADDAGGIPFYLTPGGAEAIVIRYYSALSAQNGEVRLCFERCETYAGLQLEEVR